MAPGVAIAGQDADHALGQSCFDEQAGKHEAGQGRLGSRLQHGGAAGQERRRQLADRLQQRAVPRHDARNDAGGLAVDRAAGTEGSGALLALFAAGRFGQIPAEDGDRAHRGLHRDRHAVLARRQHIEFGRQLLKPRADRFERRYAFGHGQLRPRSLVERAPGGGEGEVDIAAAWHEAPNRRASPLAGERTSSRSFVAGSAQPLAISSWSKSHVSACSVLNARLQ